MVSFIKHESEKQNLYKQQPESQPKSQNESLMNAKAQEQ